MADADITEQGRRPRRRLRTRRRIPVPADPEEREAWRGPLARRAAARMDSGGPWQWQWRRRRRRSRAMGCALWLLTLLAVLLVLALLFGGFQRGTKVGGLPGPAVPAAATPGSAPSARLP